MLRILILTAILAFASAWDPSLKVAEKIAIPHHIRHGYDYPYINIAAMMNNRPVRQGFSNPQPSAFDLGRPQSQGFQRQIQPVVPNRGFQSQPFDQGRGLGPSPVRQTRYFEFNPQRNSFFNRRQS